MEAVANAVSRATGVRFTELPMSPPKIMARLDEMKKAAE
jgi:CO/xanthine dehydrogenase Mo-binding subunit